MIYLRWLLLLPVYFLSVLCAWLVSPIAPIFAHNYSLKGTWLWWCTTPNTDLRGDPDHQKRWHYKNSYLQQAAWVWRNPAVNFQREHLGVHVEPTDEVVTIGKPDAQETDGVMFQRVLREDRTIAWMVYAYLPYRHVFKGKAFRLLLGWKTWDAHKKDPLQMCFRVTPFKSVGEKK